MNDFGLRKLNAVSAKYKERLLKEVEQGSIKTEAVSQCTCCGEKVFEDLLDQDRFGLPFGALICISCGLILTSPRIKQESLAYYYDKYYHPLNYGKESMQSQDSLYGLQQGEKIFNRLLSRIAKSKLEVLEIGAGVGNVLAEFKASAALEDIYVDVLGTEYSQQCIEMCLEKGIEVLLGDALTVSKLDRKFDIVILSHVLEHFIDIKSELFRISKLLKPDALVYIEVPGVFENHHKSYYDFSFLGYSVHAHMYNFTLDSLVNVLAQSGFSLLEGDEEVFGIFQFTGEYSTQHSSVYTKIKHYLEFLESNQEYALSQREQLQILRKELIENGLEVAQNKNEVQRQDQIINDLTQKIRLDEQVLIAAEKTFTTRNFFSGIVARYQAYMKLLEVMNDSNS